MKLTDDMVKAGWQCAYLNSHPIHLNDYWYENGNHLALRPNMTSAFDLLPIPLPNLENILLPHDNKG